MKSYVMLLSAAVLWCVLLTSCFRTADEVAENQDGKHRLDINVTRISQQPFTRAYGAESVTRLDLAIFDASGSKVVKVNHVKADGDFMHPSVSVPEGDLRLILIAHSGNGVATVSSPTEVTFPNNKVTDTFAAYTTLTIDEDTPSALSIDIELKRPVSMIRLIMTDTEMPEGFSQLQFYYTGGSSTFNPQTGYGSKNSRQTEIRTLAESTTDAEGNHIFEIFTFPHIAEDELKLTITPQKADGQAIGTPKTIESIPINVNVITELQGQIFAGQSSQSVINITINDDWGGTQHIDF